METKFIGALVAQYARPDVEIAVYDTEAKLIHTTGLNANNYLAKFSRYALEEDSPLMLSTEESTEDDGIIYTTSIKSGQKQTGAIVLKGKRDAVQKIGQELKAAMEGTLMYEKFTKEKNITKEDNISEIALSLTKANFDRDEAEKSLVRYDMDPELLRSVIYIRLDLYQNNYFNINLSLGYKASFEELKNEIIREIRESDYMTGQDMVAMKTPTTLIVIKSFQKGSDIKKAYKALDIIASDLEKTLEKYSSMSFAIAYGSIVSSLRGIRSSYKEAEEIIDLGAENGHKSGIITLEDVFFESSYQKLSPQIINKILDPALDALRRKDGVLPYEMIESCQAFVNSCMNLSLASERTHVHRNTISVRLEKLKNLTGLDPAENIKDAFLVKMLAAKAKEEMEEKKEEGKK